MLILDIECSDSGSRLSDCSGRRTSFAACAFAGAVQMGDKQATLGGAQSLLRDQRRLAASELQIHLSKNRAPAIGPLSHWAAARHLEGA
jgi:hypothetical protein